MPRRETSQGSIVRSLKQMGNYLNRETPCWQQGDLLAVRCGTAIDFPGVLDGMTSGFCFSTSFHQGSQWASRGRTPCHGPGRDGVPIVMRWWIASCS